MSQHSDDRDGTLVVATDNPRLKRLRRLQQSKRDRQNEGVFLVEGDRFAIEALVEGQAPQCVYVDADAPGSLLAELRAASDARGVPVVRVAHRVFVTLSSLSTPGSVLVEMGMPPLVTDDSKNLVIALDGVQDPGNLGTILRSVAAVDGVSLRLSSDCVDPFGSKVVRASARLVETVGIARPPDLGASLRQDVDEGRQVVIFAAGEGSSLWDLPIAPDAVLVFGSEGRGVSDDVGGSTGERCHLPLSEKAESLNVGVTVSIAIFEILRRRVSHEP